MYHFSAITVRKCMNTVVFYEKNNINCIIQNTLDILNWPWIALDDLNKTSRLEFKYKNHMAIGEPKF